MDVLNFDHSIMVVNLLNVDNHSQECPKPLYDRYNLQQSDLEEVKVVFGHYLYLRYNRQLILYFKLTQDQFLSL